MNTPWNTPPCSHQCMLIMQSHPLHRMCFGQKEWKRRCPHCFIQRSRRWCVTISWSVLHTDMHQSCQPTTDADKKESYQAGLGEKEIAWVLISRFKSAWVQRASVHLISLAEGRWWISASERSPKQPCYYFSTGGKFLPVSNFTHSYSSCPFLYAVYCIFKSPTCNKI